MLYSPPKQVGNVARLKKLHTMKKYLSFSMGMIALMAFSPQSASAEPDTGPQVDNIYIDNFSSKAGSSDITYEVVHQGDIMNHIVVCNQTIREAVPPEQSDHPVVSNSNSVVKNLVIDEGNTVATVNGNFLNCDMSNALALAAVDDPQRPCNTHIVKERTIDLDLKNSTGLAATMATASGNLRHSVAWATSYLSGSPSRC